MNKILLILYTCFNEGFFALSTAKIKKSLKKIIGLLLLPSILLSNPFEETLQNEIDWLEEETFVVSASRVKENIKKTTASISVIDEEMIEVMGAKNIYDILATIPGIGISQSNVYLEKINVRGVGTWFSDKVLVLLEGHSLNIDLLNGGATGAYKNIPVEMIERIEVIKGPASALYGENAFSALINIITKKAKDVDGTSVVFKSGSDDTKSLNLMYGKSYENMDLIFNYNYETSDGDSRYVKSDAASKSGYISPSLKSNNAYLSLIAKSGLYFSGNYNITDDGSRYGITHVINDEDLSKKRTYFSELGYKQNISENIDMHIRTYYDKFDVKNTWRIGALFQVDYQSKKWGAESLFTYKKDDVTIVSGLGYEKQKVLNASQSMNGTLLPEFIGDEKRDLKAVYSEVIYDISKELRLNTGVRYDRYSDFGGTLNPRVGAVYALNSTNDIKLMYGEAFRAPMFGELYNTNNSTIVGNPDLEPEKVKSIELSFHNRDIKNTNLSLTFFQSRINNLVEHDSSTNQYANQGKIKARGSELELRYDLKRGSYITANYIYQEPKDDDTDTILPNISKHNGYLGYNYRISRNYNLFLNTFYSSKQTRDTSDTRDNVDSAIITNATFSVKDIFEKDLKLSFMVNNLFDERSFDSGSVIDYPLGERTYLMQLNYKF